MSSYDNSENQEPGCITNCTTASIFEKPNSLRFELLFGNYQKVIPQRHGDQTIVNAFDYLFSPHQIFGFAQESTGKDFKKFEHTFVLKSCLPGQVGTIIPGISPGAEILIRTLTIVASTQLMLVIKKLQKNKVNLSQLSISYYLRLKHLLETKSNTDFLVGELIEQAKNI